MAERDSNNDKLSGQDSGASPDVAALLGEIEEPFRERMKQKGREIDDRTLAATLELARREFDRFNGSSVTDMLDWLESLARFVPPNGSAAAIDDNATLHKGAPDATLVKPAKQTDESFSLDNALARVDEILGWRFVQQWRLEQITRELHCTPAEAAAVLRIGLSRGESESAVLPIDGELAELLVQIDAGDTIDRDDLSQSRPKSSEQLLNLLDRIDEFDKETLDYGQTMHVESNDLAKVRAEQPVTRGQEFGDYELIEVIAKGGMGVVHKAKQGKLNRVVAIKTILAGQFADQTDVERFYAEAESAANLRHPNIVSIHEIGEHEGQHFFSMDYIEGQSLADMVRENAMPPKIAAEYTQAIADAMQYAHDQGILHRDLKPANILVDANNVPLITDFGLAKQVDGQSQMTMAGTIIGTPSYMPPEQAGGQIDDVDVRSDVYSLGAILFELLTGSPPFRSSSPFDTIRQVLETEPVSPRLLNAAVPPDLETICLKCLQKERPKRYQSALELSEEIGRFLDGEPILARPIGRFERTWRWCRRNPKMAALAGATMLAFLATFVTVTVAYFQTTAALAGEKIARADAEESYQQARQAVDEFFTTVAEDTLLNRYGMQPVRKELLKKALKYYEGFLAQRRNDPTIADEVAMTLFRVGFISDQMGSHEEAMKSLENARELQEALVAKTPNDAKRLHALSDTLVEISRIQLAGDAEAESLQTRVIELRQRMVDLDENNSEFARELANGHMNLGILYRERAKRSQGLAAEAESIGDQSTAERRLDAAKKEHGRAVSEYQKAQSIRRQFISDNTSDNRKLMMNYGMGFFNLGQSAADVLNVDEAAQSYREAIDVFTSLRIDAKPDFITELNLATCHRVLADHSSKHGDHEEATKNYDTAEQILTPLALRNPDELNFQRALADTYKNRGQASFEREQIQEAIQRLGQALEIERALAKRHPELPRDRGAFHDTTFAYADYHLEQNNTDEALQALQTLQDFYREAISGSLRNHISELEKAEFQLAEVSIVLADTRVPLDQLKPALADYQVALQILQSKVESAETISQLHVDYAATLLQAGEIALTLDDKATADALLRRGAEVLDTLRETSAGEEWFKELDEFAKSIREALRAQ